MTPFSDPDVLRVAEASGTIIMQESVKHVLDAIQSPLVGIAFIPVETA